MNEDLTGLSILVTGGAGFIGSHLCERLLRMGGKVICLDNLNDAYDHNIKKNNIQAALSDPGFTLVEGDILDAALVEGVMERFGIDTVIHLAALAGVRSSIESPLDYVDTDIKGTVTLLEASRKHAIKKFIFASSSSVYGTAATPFSEADTGLSQVSPYAAAKYSGELFLRTFHDLYGIPTVCLRFFTVYGPRQRPDMAIHKFTRAAAEGRVIDIFGNGGSSRDYTYIDDTIDGIIASIRLKCGFEVINLGNSSATGLSDLVKFIEKSLNKTVKTRFLPDQQGDVPVTFADISKAASLLDYRPKVGLTEGIGRFVDWYEKNNRPLKIVQVAPDIYPVPPSDYGGIEIIVYEITEELVRRGHEVWLYAPAGSRTSARLIPYEHTTKGDSAQIAEFVKKTLPKGIDIIHDHTLSSAVGKAGLPVPAVCTIHGAILNSVKYPVYVSRRALEVIGDNRGYYVYNGLDLEKYEFSGLKSDYLLYMSRVDRVKGIEHALDIADRTKKKLVIAGPIHDKAYFSSIVEPRIRNNPNIRYAGSVGGQFKQDLLKYAACLLFPTSWEEPFGLVMIEAMACGTPVAALSNGAVPEVLKRYPELICRNTNEMTALVNRGSFPAPEALRKYALSRFTTAHMVDSYLEVYKNVLQREKDEKHDNGQQAGTGRLQSDQQRPEAEYEEISKVTACIKNRELLHFAPDNKRLRIVQVAPDAITVPPKDYGGIERVVYDLTEELVRQGHEVFLYAKQGSRTSSKLIPYPHQDGSAQAVAAFVSANMPEGIDIIHDHTHASVIGKLGLNIPVVSTIHDSRKNTAENAVYLCRKALRDVGGNMGFYAYNGINIDDYEFSCEKQDYLLFIGLLYSHKGINYAMDVAEKAGKKLVIAGPIYKLDYYKDEIEPRLLNNPNFRYVGSVGGNVRQQLLKYAECMLFPTVWEEPFGLVMIEAMACGTPVLAFGNGAVPEVLSGFPGLICKDAEEMAHKVLNPSYPDAAALRKYVGENFSSGKMAERYLQIYGEVIGKHTGKNPSNK